MDFTIHFFSRFGFSRFGFDASDMATDGHPLVTIASRWADDGYTEELRELWSPRGELLTRSAVSSSRGSEEDVEDGGILRNDALRSVPFTQAGNAGMSPPPRSTKPLNSLGSKRPEDEAC